MECPKCKSDNTQRLEVIFDNGTQDINTRSSTVGTAYGRGGLGVGGGSTKTTGQSQTKQAQKAAPPKKPSWWVVVPLVFMGVILLLNVWYIGLALLGFAYFVGTKVIASKKTYPGLYQNWLSSWMCNKCGEIYRMD